LLTAFFANKWNFYHTCEAVEGKCITIKCCPNSGSMCFNYKKFCSLVLMALVNTNSRFLYINLSANHEMAVLPTMVSSFSWTLGKAPEQGCAAAGLPDPEPSPGDDRDISFAVVGDEAFGLKTWMTKPYPHCGLSDEQRKFNFTITKIF
jgi:hypothetical protein